jgi:hypothetical protein
MGDVVELAERRGKIRISDAGSFTTTATSVEIHGYSFWGCASTVLGLLSQGAIFRCETIVLRVIPTPPLPPPEPPKPPELLVNREISKPSFWSWLKRILRPRLRAVPK